MKNRFFIAIIAIMTTLFVLASCGKKEVTEETTAEIKADETVAADATEENKAEEKTTAEEATEEVTEAQQEKGIYETEIAMLKGLFDGSTELFSEGTAGISDLINMRGADEAAALVGYAVTDISGDGEDELVVSVIEENGKGSMLLAVFTKNGKKTVNVLEGTSRSAYFLLENGLLYQGSNGAATSIFAEYALTADGKTLICKDYWFTAADSENPYELEFYHNTKGEIDTASSEKLDVTEDEFFAKQTELAFNKKQIALTAFGK